jgi:recombination protein RecT
MSNNQLATQSQEVKLTSSQRFTDRVLAEFRDGAGEIAVSEFQRRLIQNYFIAIDMSLKTAETNRMKKDAKYRDAVPVTWENVNMPSLALDVVKIARLGLDSAQKNHINFIAYKNNTTKKYDIGFIVGYVGLEHNAKKYALDMPDDVITEVVYSKDVFKPIKRSATNKTESYEFEIVNAFDRGEIVGGFYYYAYSNAAKNKLVVMKLADILKRRPDKASAEFWGGQKDVWKDGKKTGEKEDIEGWFEEMCLKTIKRAAYNAIPLDPQKIDDNYQWLKSRENQIIDMQVDEEIEQNANTIQLDVEDYSHTDVDTDTGEILEDVAAASTPAEAANVEAGEMPQMEFGA